MRWRGLANRQVIAWAATVACGLLLMLTGAASASNAGAPPTGPSQPAPCYGTGCKGPCVVGFAVECESRDPNVTINYPVEAGCSYQGTVDWGDGDSQPASFTGTSTTSYTDLTHSYQTTQVFEAKLAGTETCPGYSPGAPDSSPFSETYSFEILAGHYRVVAVGDSFSSGEGAKHYATRHADPQCDRSPDAWPLLLTRHSTKVASVVDLACSGATSAALNGRVKGQPDQLALLGEEHPSLVTLTIGGNDVHFADLLKACFNPFYNCVTHGTIAKLDRDIHHELRILTDDYVDVAEAAPHARVLVVGYPQLFPDLADFTDSGLCHALTHTAANPHYNPSTRTKRYDALVELAAGDALLNSTVASAVALADLRLARHDIYNRIEYVSAYNALNHHQFCTAASFLIGLGSFNPIHEYGHPTVAGQSAIATEVARYINQSL